MKKIHISFGNELYYKSLDLLEETSLNVGKVDKFIRYTQEWLKTENFWQKNLYILLKPRGAGYWIWKPFIILKTFEQLNDGDCVLYSDAGLKVIDNLDPLFRLLKTCPNQGKIFFRVPWIGAEHKAKIWIKRDCFILTNCNEPKYWNAPMINGAISLWIKNKENIEFLNQWQHYLRDSRIVTDDPNVCGYPNFYEFKDHRHDQAVLSLLAVKNNFELFRDPTQWGNEEISLFSNSPYKQLFYHHRNFKH
jgi:hypothetical protein